MRKYTAIMGGMLILFGLYLTSLYSFLLFHSLIELFSIVVACGIFIIAWNSRQFMNNNFLLFLGIAYLFIGGLDLIHTLGYVGMSVFQGYGTTLSTQLWISARYIESFSLLMAFLFLSRKLKSNFVFAGYTLATVLLLVSIFYWNVFPLTFIEGVGLTPFKKISEYIISLILLGSLVLLFRNRRQFDKDVLQLLAAAIIMTIGAELAFAFYISAFGLSNLIGHFFKLISFYLIYRAIIQTGFTKPYSLLFRNLKQNEELLTQQAEELKAEISERKQMQERLLTSERLATLGEFSGSISHELRNPLGVIGSSAYYLKTRLKGSDDKVKEHLDRIQGSVGRATAIIESLLNLTRMKEPRLGGLNLVAITHDSIVAAKVPVTVNVVEELPEQELLVSADMEQIRMALTNIVKNSVEAMDRKGTLTATVRRTADSQVEVSFADTGPGIAEENLEKVFQPLFSTKASGIGFGLSIAKMVAEKHGGTIAAKSEPGKGATIMIKLPLYPDKDKEA